jgi:hypothetical protein
MQHYLDKIGDNNFNIVREVDASVKTHLGLRI